MKERIIYELYIRHYTQYGFQWEKETYDRKKDLEERLINLDLEGYDDQIKIIRKVETDIYFGYLQDVFTEK